MARLIHLNGPSGVGKSTLARRYADDHPGTMVLDLDVLAGVVDGWREDFSGALEVARGHGRELAARHLRGGQDVILPQLVTVHDHERDPALQDLARAAGAAYIEIALTVSAKEHLRRLQDKRPSTEVEAHTRSALLEPGSDLLSNIRRHLAEHLDARPHVRQIDTTGSDEDATYLRLLETLGAG